jgi:hypothetical protein
MRQKQRRPGVVRPKPQWFAPSFHGFAFGLPQQPCLQLNSREILHCEVAAP